MGWASGSELLGTIFEAMYQDVPKSKQKKLAKILINAFEDMDCDTIPEAFNKKWPALEETYREMYPEQFEDED